MQKLQLEQLQAQKAKTAADLEAEKAKEAKKTTEAAENRVGIRSLLSNGWAGYERGGDLAPR